MIPILNYLCTYYIQFLQYTYMIHIIRVYAYVMFKKFVYSHNLNDKL